MKCCDCLYYYNIEINEIPELEREGYIKSVHAIKSWADTMEYNINNKVKEIN